MSPIFLAALLLFTTAHVNANQDGAADICAKQGNCRDCLHAGPLCSWCNKKGYEGSRCDLHVIHREKCKGEFDDQKTQEQWIIEDRNLTEPHSKNDDLIVQLKPQRLSLKLRPGVKHTVPIQFRQAEDYPVDLYYLMDLSNSMSDDKEKLAKLGKELGDEMNKITRNFRLGFGSFVDKVVMPYVSMVPEKLQEPCTRCVPPYGFRNHLPLTDDTQRFVTEVQAANVSGNLDAPEGGFDAIMQAVVCEGEIAWRKNARRLLLFSTDAGFHYAGDGKLGGIVTPHDGQCHMRSNEYTHSDKLDYPSLSQINSKIQENKVNIIFAVTEDQESIYSKLANMLEGCSHGKLANDSSNVVSLVKEQYRQITSQIEMTYEIRKPNDPEKESSKQKDDETYIKVTFQSKCKDLSLAKPIETNKCNQIYVGDQVQFDAQIELKKCPKDPKDWKRVIQISPVGLNEKLVIDLEMVCACACESTPGERKSSECNGVGTYQCGICQCDDGHSGKSCECEDSNNSKVGEETCRAKGDSRLCSGRGECHCGQCRCNPRNTPTEVIEGPYCECDNFSCDRHNNKLCGGDDRGKCVCGKCSCNAGWTGADCSCATSDDRCKTANGICNGHGTCHCGKCICDQDFTGDTCSECPTCPGKCIEFKDCVECQAFPDNPGRRYDTKELCHENCDSQFMTIKSPLRDYDEEKGDKLCIFRDAQDCKITFVYREENGRYQVRAKDKECAEPVDILAIIIAVILGIVLIGLFLLLIWKLLTTIHDRREYAKFEDERQRGRFETGVNPIYKRAITTFKNPTYGGGR